MTLHFANSMTRFVVGQMNAKNRHPITLIIRILDIPPDHNAIYQRHFMRIAPGSPCTQFVFGKVGDVDFNRKVYQITTEKYTTIAFDLKSSHV